MNILPTIDRMSDGGDMFNEITNYLCCYKYGFNDEMDGIFFIKIWIELKIVIINYKWILCDKTRLR